LIRSFDPTCSSAIGIERLNRYAVGSFALAEEKMVEPAKLEDLLVKYAQIWNPVED
jgi:hypothetical protein